jgi:small-conductance mechanosensitive channel
MARFNLKEILEELAVTIGRSHLLEHIANLDGNIDATPEPEKPGEAEEIAQQMAELQRRADELNAAKAESEGGKSE